MKRIIVTGANKGIGLAIVTKLLEDFPDTYLLLGSRDIGRGQGALEQIGEVYKDRVELLQIDVTSDESVKNAVEAVKAKHGDTEPLFGLVNNAGGTLGPTDDSARGTVELNTYGLRRVCEAFLPLIQKDKGVYHPDYEFYNQYFSVQGALFRFPLVPPQCFWQSAARKFNLSWLTRM